MAICQSDDGSILNVAAIFAAKSKDAGHQTVSNLLLGAQYAGFR
jgi:hypothetical protein